MSERLLRRGEIKGITGLSPTTIWRLEAEGKFPAHRLISRGLIGWLSSEVDAWLQSRPAIMGRRPVKTTGSHE
jgi:prophage regulatory protein